MRDFIPWSGWPMLNSWFVCGMRVHVVQRLSLFRISIGWPARSRTRAASTGSPSGPVSPASSALEVLVAEPILHVDEDVLEAAVARRHTVSSLGHPAGCDAVRIADEVLIGSFAGGRAFERDRARSHSPVAGSTGWRRAAERSWPASASRRMPLQGVPSQRTSGSHQR